MKKITILSLLLVFSLTFASAQSIQGQWMVDQETLQREGVAQDDKTVIMVLAFEDDNCVILMDVSGDEPELGELGMQFYMPGTFTQNGKTVSCQFVKELGDMEISTFNPSDEDLKELVSTDEGRKIIINAIKERVKDSIDDVTNHLYEFTTYLFPCEIVSQTQDKLTVKASDGTIVGFDRLPDN
ncbi:MAG: hypothetical protein J6X81_03725 [Muribaculaceae bacterium]|nr:hypothetical protein [Muribaculaceae bacterium]